MKQLAKSSRLELLESLYPRAASDYTATRMMDGLRRKENDFSCQVNSPVTKVDWFAACVAAWVPFCKFSAAGAAGQREKESQEKMNVTTSGESDYQKREQGGSSVAPDSSA